VNEYGWLRSVTAQLASAEGSPGMQGEHDDK
jgi:hypothetical protein